MSVSDVIKKAAREKGVALTKIAKAVGMTNAGFYRMLDGTTLKVETLQKIAEVLEVPIVLFFGIEGENANGIEALKKENAMLLELNRTYKKLITIYESESQEAGNIISAMDWIVRCLREPIFASRSAYEKERIKEFFRINIELWNNNTEAIFNKYGLEDESVLILHLSKVIEKLIKKMTKEDWSKPVGNFF